MPGAKFNAPGVNLLAIPNVNLPFSYLYMKMKPVWSRILDLRGPWAPGTKGQGPKGQWVPRAPGPKSQWVPVTRAPRANGSKGQWAPGAHGPQGPTLGSYGKPAWDPMGTHPGIPWDFTLGSHGPWGLWCPTGNEGGA